MNADRATQQFFHAYPASVRREAEILQQDGSVRHIFGGPKFIQARVRVEDEFRVRLDLIAGRWEATVEPKVEPESDIAACVVMYERLARGGRIPATPGETDEGDLREQLADSLGRELEARELTFLDKLEKRFRRFELEGSLHDHDLVRLNPQYPLASNDQPLQLWTTPPRDILEFWNYIAYEFEKQRVGYPRFMKPITDTAKVRSGLEDWERQQTLERWDSLLDRPARPPRGPRSIPLQLRLILSFNDLRVQWRPDDRHLWEPLSGPQQLADWADAAARDELRLDAPSALLWQALREPLSQSEDLRLSLARPSTLELLSHLLRQPALRPSILTLDEVPLEFPGPDEALSWELRPARDPQLRGEDGSDEGNGSEDPKDADKAEAGPAAATSKEGEESAAEPANADSTASDSSSPAVNSARRERAATLADPRLQLIYADGSEVPYTLRLLPGHPPLYLDDGLALIGPVPIQLDASEVEPQLEVPREVARSQRGLDWLEAIGAEISPALDLGIEEVPLTLHFHLELARELTRASSEHATLRVEARGPGAEASQSTTDEAQADDNEATHNANPAEANHSPEPDARLEILERDQWRIEQDGSRRDAAPVRYRRGHAALVLDLLDNFGFTWDAGENLFRARVTRNFPERFSEWSAALPADIALHLDDNLASLREPPLLAKVRFEVSQGAGDIDWFDLKIAMEVEGLNLSQERLRQLVAARGGFVRDEDGRWLRLDIDLDPDQIELVERLGLDPFDLSGEQHRMHASQLADPQAREIFAPEAWEKITARARELELATTEEPPADLQATLRPYQLAGFRFLCYLARNQFGGILADDMGLGKTVQSLSWLLWLKHHAEQEGRAPRPSLVVAPKSVLDVWDGEAAKFAPALRVLVVRSQDEVDFEELETQVDLVVLNYAQLRTRETELKQRTWRAIVLDEGQQIKNPDSRAAKAARTLQAEHRLVLTGTPIENRLLDLWSIMAFAQPGVLGNRSYFRKRFDRRKDPSSAGMLGNRLRPFLLRRTKSEVAIDLPDRITEDLIANMEAAQEQLYQRELKRIQEQLLSVKNEEGLRKNNMVVLQGLMRLRQVCCHPGLIEPSLMDAASAKMDSLFYLLDQLREEGHKVLVFSQFVKMLEIIEARLKTEDRPYNLLTGQTRDRRRVIRDFQTSKDPNVFLLSLKAGGTGLNLTQASYVILYDPWWNPAVENQAIDRVHRIGQENKVIAYRLLVRNSIEQKIRLLQTRKTELFKGVLGDSSFAGTLNLEDIQYLFSYDKQAEDEFLEEENRRRRRRRA